MINFVCLHKNYDPGENLCSICQEPHQESVIEHRFGEGSHYYSVQDLADWMAQGKKTCPGCQTGLPEVYFPTLSFWEETVLTIKSLEREQIEILAKAALTLIGTMGFYISSVLLLKKLGPIFVKLELPLVDRVRYVIKDYIGMTLVLFAGAFYLEHLYNSFPAFKQPPPPNAEFWKNRILKVHHQSLPP